MDTVNMLSIFLQILVGLTILNVWVVRPGKRSPFRGGDATNMREEFAVYGLPYWFMCLSGGLKVTLALALLLGVWINGVATWAAMGLGLLMLGAVIMHIKVKDPILKALPSISLLASCIAIFLL